LVVPKFVITDLYFLFVFIDNKNNIIDVKMNFNNGNNMV